MNVTCLDGRLAADPEAGRGATPQARIRLAVDAYDPATKSRTADFINMVAFGRTAETILKYCRKGSWISIRGHLKPRSWETPTGKKFELSVVIDDLTLGPKSAGGVSAAPIPWESEPGSVSRPPDDPYSFE